MLLGFLGSGTVTSCCCAGEEGGEGSAEGCVVVELLLLLWGYGREDGCLLLGVSLWRGCGAGSQGGALKLGVGWWGRSRVIARVAFGGRLRGEHCGGAGIVFLAEKFTELGSGVCIWSWEDLEFGRVLAFFVLGTEDFEELALEDSIPRADGRGASGATSSTSTMFFQRSSSCFRPPSRLRRMRDAEPFCYNVLSTRGYVRPCFCRGDESISKRVT